MSPEDALYAICSQVSKKALDPDFRILDLKTGKHYSISELLEIVLDAIKNKADK